MKRMTSIKISLGLAVVLAIVAMALYLSRKAPLPVTSFADCVARGYPVAQSYPRECLAPGGIAFKEDIGNELAMDNLIRIQTPRPNAVVSNPFVVSGFARGSWFFEAVFPVTLLDSAGAIIASGQAHATKDWMTSDFVPFTAALAFKEPATATGTLVLKNDNPSGLPQNDKTLEIPVSFKK